MTSINSKNIFLDRDGVINEVIIRDGVISSPRSFNQFKYREDFLEFRNKIISNQNFFVVTNQPDISRKLLRKEDLEKMHHKIQTENTFITEIVACIHDDHQKCNCRKPKPGMIHSLIKKHNLDYSSCLLIGDSIKDIQAAKSAGIDYYLLETEYNSHVKTDKKIKSLASLFSNAQ